MMRIQWRPTVKAFTEEITAFYSTGGAPGAAPCVLLAVGQHSYQSRCRRSSGDRAMLLFISGSTSFSGTVASLSYRWDEAAKFKLTASQKRRFANCWISESLGLCAAAVSSVLRHELMEQQVVYNRLRVHC